MMMYEQIKNRAIELLQTESNDRPSFEKLCCAESSVRNYYIRDAIVRACNELPPPRDRRKSYLAQARFYQSGKRNPAASSSNDKELTDGF
jgi:hypothetical protein